jgi:hypothetical protein
MALAYLNRFESFIKKAKETLTKQRKGQHVLTFPELWLFLQKQETFVKPLVV